MINAKTSLRWLAPLAMMLAMTLAAGCAPAYHGHCGCCVDCHYCAPPPLPYTHYAGCACHCCAVSRYRSLQPPPGDRAAAETEGNESAD